MHVHVHVHMHMHVHVHMHMHMHMHIHILAITPPRCHVQVMVQLPMFNETFVARRIIDYSCKMEYPREAFEVQVRRYEEVTAVGEAV